ncbi:hypothetical protein [Actinoplanes sp. NPDC049316]|uniref:hypothetical protein n=1 Tax=Actinoplanes sp. NPDC049316 TaxID=3154727 RepID=UPI00342A1A77
MVLAVLVCVLTAHGWHDDAAPLSAAATSGHSPMFSAADATAAGDEIPSAAADAHDHHHPHGASCDPRSSVDRSQAVVVLPLVHTGSPAPPAEADTPAACTQAAASGRCLLLLQCISRT